MTIDDRLERILSSLDALLQGGHVEAARLIIAEVRHRHLEDPGVDPLTVIDDEAFEDLTKRIREEAFRRERLRHPHTGHRWCKLARRVIVGDVVVGDVAPFENGARERTVGSTSEREGWVHLEFTDGSEGCRRRSNDMLVVKKRPGE